MAKPKSNPLERFESFVSPEPNSGCWLWTGYLDAHGYARLGVVIHDGRWIPRPAHQIAYEVFRGPIPDGLVLDHLCRVRCCVNPDHLEAVTNEENLKRGIRDAGNKAACAKARAKTHCKHGHQYTDETTLRDKNGNRFCSICRKASFRRTLDRLMEERRQKKLSHLARTI